MEEKGTSLREGERVAHYRLAHRLVLSVNRP